MKLLGKMCFKIILKVTKNQSFTCSLEDTFFRKTTGGVKLTLPNSFKFKKKVIYSPTQIPHSKLYDNAIKIWFWNWILELEESSSSLQKSKKLQDNRISANLIFFVPSEIINSSVNIHNALIIMAINNLILQTPQKYLNGMSTKRFGPA